MKIGDEEQDVDKVICFTTHLSADDSKNCTISAMYY